MRYKAVNVRLDPDTLAILDALVEQDKAKIEAIGLIAEANYSSVLRRLIKAEAKADPLIPSPSPVPPGRKRARK